MGSVVYFVRQGNRGPVKIGTTTRLYARMDELRTANSFQLVLLAHEPGDRAHEAALHRRFAGSRGRGEWFWATPELCDYIRNIGGTIDGIGPPPTYRKPKRWEDIPPDDAPEPDCKRGELSPRVVAGMRGVLDALLEKDRKR